MNHFNNLSSVTHSEVFGENMQYKLLTLTFIGYKIGKKKYTCLSNRIMLTCNIDKNMNNSFGMHIMISNFHYHKNLDPR